MFRNTRKELQGFPKRQPVLHPLDILDDNTPSFEQKITWLVDWLSEHRDEKVLLICQTRELVEEIYQAVQEQVNLNLSQFHEGLNLIQRDRQAAYFTIPKVPAYSSAPRSEVKVATSSLPTISFFGTSPKTPNSWNNESGGSTVSARPAPSIFISPTCRVVPKKSGFSFIIRE